MDLLCKEGAFRQRCSHDKGLGLELISCQEMKGTEEEGGEEIREKG